MKRHLHPPRHDEVDRVLASSACPFSMVGEKVRARLASAMEVRDYDTGELVVRQGDRGRFLLVLIDGSASACVHQRDGEVTSIADLHAGSLIGEMSLVTDEPRTADVVCQTPVRAALLAVDDFEALALEYPELRAVLTEVVAERLGQSTYDSLSGKDVNGYRIVRCLGRGGMGIVYEAASLVGGSRVALKMMNHRLLYQPRALQRFQREADTLKSLSHPVIARIYAHFTAYKTQFLVLELCQGTTLIRRSGRARPWTNRPCARLSANWPMHCRHRTRPRSDPSGREAGECHAVRFRSGQAARFRYCERGSHGRSFRRFECGRRRDHRLERARMPRHAAIHGARTVRFPDAGPPGGLVRPGLCRLRSAHRTPNCGGVRPLRYHP